ncbi:MmcQ/YjbR family DNA-binding protein [Cohnella nanjingensis]|uniref:MmcQ/YjbR family DNA-binding protein n=1 Tax=Cohnella nanjingensis TaxID=1387779 RepID=A0A7X0RR87_9BACL|nr:MmcQ/YjbR family DNA-binding protein [Cohnella nanjingensis]MBB6672080.1 MmcQ/YjbR family DNA-binding protein [Cohnella nanjingensis]
MKHQDLIALGLSYAGTSLRYPFDPKMPVLYVGSKMFALLGDWQGSESVNLKTSPDEAWLQRETYPGTVFPGYHMNKRHWNTVVLDGTVPDRVVSEMLEASYLLVYANLPKAERLRISQTSRPNG